MKNRQLMRLNLVSHKGQVKTIDCISPGQVILLEDRNTEESFGGWVDLDEIEFIELTEEFLLKFGFKNRIDINPPFRNYKNIFVKNSFLFCFTILQIINNTRKLYFINSGFS